jgi:hypothetical protein
MLRSARFSIVLTFVLAAGLSGGALSAAAATTGHSASHRLSAPASSSLLPAGLAQAIEQTLGPAAATRSGQFAQQQELAAPDGAPGDQFGYSVALSGDGHIALVGAPSKNSGTGAAYIFTEQANTWTEQQELVLPDGAPDGQFGYSVALNSNGHIALIGARFKNSLKGAAYVFAEQANTWTEQQELTAPDGSPRDLFGSSVALNSDGNIALVGAPGKNTSQGAAYVFTERDRTWSEQYGNTWTEQQELTASDGAPADQLGYSLALNGDGHIALVGAWGKNGQQGAAYVFTEQANTWTAQQELTAPDGAPGDNFGFSVALNSSGHIALVGARDKNSDKGAAYVFTEQANTWTAQQELTASDGSPGDVFGFSVALNSSGHIALIGAPSKNSGTGAAYVFTERDRTWSEQYGNTWTEQQELTASDGAHADQLGYSVALNSSGHIALIGARGKNIFQGEAYVFTKKH